jgi:sterol desaturase/sphingolipid hydroxylase (fatty acid hydroxylase superfamily)
MSSPGCREVHMKGNEDGLALLIVLMFIAYFIGIYLIPYIAHR